MDSSQNKPSYTPSNNWAPTFPAPPSSSSSSSSSTVGSSSSTLLSAQHLAWLQEENEIMVSAFVNVMSRTAGDTSPPLPPLTAGAAVWTMLPSTSEKKDEEQLKYKGVRQRRPGRWSAEIWDPHGRAKKWLGTFPTQEMAARAYNDAAAQLAIAGDRRHPVTNPSPGNQTAGDNEEEEAKEEEEEEGSWWKSFNADEMRKLLE